MTKTLSLNFHGRLIQHLGIQMYQKPDAALAEMISNAWDADAYNVTLTIPEVITEAAEIVIEDDGSGMTFEECQAKFLMVGRSRRGSNPDEKSPKEGRPILGRKGIGKFAGFGIAKTVEVHTISEINGEKTVFKMDIDTLMSGAYAEAGGPVKVLQAEDPDEDRKNEHGTKIVLKGLTIDKTIVLEDFTTSMSRRFLLAQQSNNFSVSVNGQKLEQVEYNPDKVQYSFPSVYTTDVGSVFEPPENTVIVDGWGVSTLSDSHIVRWKIDFYKLPISHEEFRGVAIYAKGKLAQSAFMFNLAGGLSGQHGQEYISGRVTADYIDAFEQDVISTERQRINWETNATNELEEWGQNLVKKLLKEWQKLRQREKEQYLESKVKDFSGRLDRLEKHERKTVEEALKKIANVPSLSAEQFAELGGAVLTSWELGRNKKLIDEMASAEELGTEQFLDILLESSVLSALSMAEGARTRLETVRKLKEMVDIKERENTVRDYIARDAWIINPEFETFKKETKATSVIEAAKSESGDILADGEKGDDYKGRVDLVLSSGDTLVLVEFMRPGLTMDWDHLSRFERYMHILKEKIKGETTLGFTKVKGYIVADNLERRSEVRSKIEGMQDQGMFAMSWGTLIDKAVSDWSFYLQSIVTRGEADERLLELLPGDNN